jgi:plastocyanin domain-containing protein
MIKMDKTLRNIIIFAVAILLIATVFTVVMLSKRISPDNGTTTVPDNNNNGNTIPTGEVQNVKLSVSGGTYILSPSVLKKDVPVVMTADMATLKGCSRSVVISSFGVRKSLTETNNVITFTPTQAGTFKIACSMNMYRGTFTVE